MKIAIEGCCHGELEKIYATLKHMESENNIKIDLLIICGDFQAIRNEKDLQSMAVPDKYRHMCGFWKYYAGLKKADILTLFIGGNHEASNYLSELPYGGWVAPNIYYMGYANVIQFAGLRIAGLSGIFKPNDYYKGHYEIAPYNPGSMHSVYHVRNLEIFRMSQLKQHVDIVVTHDWPRGVYNHGDYEQLIRFKPFLADEIRSNSLGSPVNEQLLNSLKPDYWFSAHLHAKFACVYKHDQDPNGKATKFLALDKCLPHRRFLQVIDIEPKPCSESAKTCLSLDPEWLCVLKKTDNFLSVESYNQAPLTEKDNIEISEQDLNDIREDFQESFEIPSNFRQTAPSYKQNQSDLEQEPIQDIYLNEQTTLFCEMLDIRDPIRVLLEKRGKSSFVNESKTQMYNNLLDEDDNDVDND